MARCRKFPVINHIRLIFFWGIVSEVRSSPMYSNISFKNSHLSSLKLAFPPEYFAYTFEINQDKVDVGGPCQDIVNYSFAC